MNYSQLINIFSKRTGLSKNEAKNMVEILFETIKDGIKENGEVNIYRFGKFYTKEQKKRTTFLNKKQYEVPCKESYLLWTPNILK